MTKLNKTYFPIALIILLVGTLLGFCAYAYSENYLFIDYQKGLQLSLDPIEIFSIAINILLAVWILRKLSRDDDSEKVERDLIIRYFEDFDKDLMRAVRKSSQNGVKYAFVVAALKELRIRLLRLLSLAIEQGFITNDSVCTIALPEHLKGLRKLLTTTPRKGAVEDGIRVEEGKLYFSDEHINKINAAMFETNNGVFRLLVEVTRARR
ncbi:MAG: hypothetical protein JWM46_721 [Candidatus Kaiserbacteria bacterium]|nr:hypothetical protein [Candidatus Kaiserbacteria bacterium]